MNLPMRSFSQLVQDMSAAVQGAAVGLIDLSVGSVLRTILEANASLGLWIQWLILSMLKTTRAATSSGPDLDSWMSDFGVIRLPTTTSTGQVNFSRYATTLQALVPSGSLVKTSDASMTFVVIPDSSNLSWSASSNAYVLPVGVSNVTATVQCQTPGADGNVQAAAISLIGSALPGIDTVSNAAAFSNGRDAESDEAFRERFQGFLDSRCRATSKAIGYAIGSIQEGISYLIQENVDTTGARKPGSFIVTVDDGSGSPSSALLAEIGAAVDVIRPVGSVFTIQPPIITTANLSMTVLLEQSIGNTILPAITNAISFYVNGLGIGSPLSITRIAQVTYHVSTGIVNISNIEINGQTIDLVPSPNGVVKVGTVTVN